MNYEHILVDIEDGVGIVTLNRPEKLNAMNRRLGAELQDAVKQLDDDDAVGCIVLTGAGRAFSAGGDIHEHSRMTPALATRARPDAHKARLPRRQHLEEAGNRYDERPRMAGGGRRVRVMIGCETANSAFSPQPFGGSTAPDPPNGRLADGEGALFSARCCAEACIGPGHLVRDQLRAKTMERRTIVGNNRAAVIGIKQLLLRQMVQDVEQQWDERLHDRSDAQRQGEGRPS